MNPHLTYYLAQAHTADLLREAQHERLAPKQVRRQVALGIPATRRTRVPGPARAVRVAESAHSGRLAVRGEMPVAE